MLEGRWEGGMYVQVQMMCGCGCVCWTPFTGSLVGWRWWWEGAGTPGSGDHFLLFHCFYITPRTGIGKKRKI